MLRWIFVFAGIGWIWSTHVNMHFVSWLEWKGYGQHMMRCIYYHRWHCMSLVNTRWDEFCVLACIGWVSSIHVEMHFVSSLAWDGFGQPILWYFFVSSLALDEIDHHVLKGSLFIPRHRIRLVKTIWDTFCGLAGIGWDWSTHVEVVLVSSLADTYVSSLSWYGFSQHALRYILCSRWLIRG